MNRMPYPAAESISPAVQALLAARPPRNLFRMMAHAPALMPGIMELTGAVLYRSKLEPVLRELVILRVGHLCGCSYEVAQHRKIARAIGLPEGKIDGTAVDADPARLGDNELLVLRMTEQVVRKVKADDELFAAVTAALGHELTMEVLVVIGLYVMLAQVLENTEVALEEGVGPSEQDVRKIFGSQGRK